MLYKLETQFPCQQSWARAVWVQLKHGHGKDYGLCNHKGKFVTANFCPFTTGDPLCHNQAPIAVAAPQDDGRILETLCCCNAWCFYRRQRLLRWWTLGLRPRDLSSNPVRRVGRR